MGLPFVYVRAAAKDHGRKNLIEGEIRDDQSVVVIEDLISTGQSSLKAVEALREAGFNVKGMISIFNYGFELSKQNFENAQCPLISLCDYTELINQALESGYIKENDVEILQQWRMAPELWGN